MSVTELERRLGRSLGDGQRSRFYETERQNAETGQNSMMQMSSLLTTATASYLQMREEPEEEAAGNSLAGEED